MIKFKPQFHYFNWLGWDVQNIKKTLRELKNSPGEDSRKEEIDVFQEQLDYWIATHFHL